MSLPCLAFCWMPASTHVQHADIVLNTRDRFNASGDHECPWQLLNASEWQSLSHTDATSGLPAGSSGCYGASLTKHSRINLFRQDEYFIPDMQGILNGTYQWSPDNWISTDTLELSHRFTLFFQNDRRFAVVNIAASIDAAGSVVQRSISGSSPSFETFTPFMLEDGHAVHTLLELALYLFFFKLLVDEMVTCAHNLQLFVKA